MKIRNYRYPFFLTLLLLSLSTYPPSQTIAAEPESEATGTIIIRESYVNIYTGPGKGYPIFFIAERGEAIELLQIQTEWFKVRTPGGVEGWAYHRDLAQTLSQTGNPISFKEYVKNNYRNQRLEVGLSAGRLSDDNVGALRVSYRFNPIFTAEANWLQSSEDAKFSSAYTVNVLMHPFSHRRYSPYITLGAGQFHADSQSTTPPNLTQIEGSSDAVNVGLGVAYYFDHRFLFRLDYRNHFIYVSDDEIASQHELMAGLAFFYGSHAQALFKEIFDAELNSRDLSVGMYLSSYSLEDLEADFTKGIKLNYRITDSIFIETSLAQSDLEDNGYEIRGLDPLPDGNNKLRYYNVVVGYNALPGEIAITENWRFPTQIYFVGGLGNTELKKDDHFTVTVGAGIRIYPFEHLALHWDMRDHIFNSDIWGEEETTHNFEVSYGISYVF